MGQATLAVDSDAPDVMLDSHGNGALGKFSPDFIAWAKAHNVDPNEADRQASFEFPVYIILLGETGDPRAIPLLRRALQSRNYQIEAAAAEGLAQINDKASIPTIIGACQRAPANVAGTIANALVYFDDSDAQKAVDTFMSPDNAKASRDARAKGKKPFGW